MKPRPHTRLDRFDRAVADLMDRYGHGTHRVLLGVFFAWMGLLKQFGKTTGSSLLADTIYYGDPAVMVPLLGVWEVAIGVCLIVRPLNRIGLLLLLVRLPGTLLALVLRKDVCFDTGLWAPTLQGQYLIKDFFLFSAAMVVGATVRHERVPGRFH